MPERDIWRVRQRPVPGKRRGMPDRFPWQWLANPEPGSLRYPRLVHRGKVPVWPYKTGHVGVELRCSPAISNQALKFLLRSH